MMAAVDRFVSRSSVRGMRSLAVVLILALLPLTADAVKTPKKGVGFWNMGNKTADALINVDASWGYNWGSATSIGLPDGFEFVPMIWGRNNVTASALANALASGSENLLAFNEPDLADQAGMSVSEALALWPQLEATGMRLGSPAVAFGAERSSGWFADFMAGAEARGYRVDFIAVHRYIGRFDDMASAVGGLKNFLQAVYDRYQKPIWLTEYNVAYGERPATWAESAEFAKLSIEMMESLPFVERYAWFAMPAVWLWPGFTFSENCLAYDNGSLTPAGIAYRDAGTVDATPPTTPSGLNARATGERRIDLTWNAASDPDSGVAFYKIYRNNAYIGRTYSLAYSDTEVADATTYSYQVSAVNGGGTEGSKSLAAAATTWTDSTRPAIASVLTAANDPNHVTVTYSEPVNKAIAETKGNYAISKGIVVNTAVLGGDRKTVKLGVSTMSAGATYVITINNIKDLASTPNTILANSQGTFLYTEITGTWVSSADPAIAWSTAAIGEPVYCDRSTVFLNLPAAYVGLDYLKTPNDDKQSTANPYLTFEVSADATVYVALDPRVAVPSWLSSWADTGDTMQVGTRTFRIYSKEFAAGTVSLGGNEHPDIYCNMYSVMVRPSATTEDVVPAAPSSIVYPASSATGRYTVEWAASPEAVSYEVGRSVDAGATWEAGYAGAETSFGEKVGDGAYRYRVRALNGAGSSDWRTGETDCVVVLSALEEWLRQQFEDPGDEELDGLLTDPDADDVVNLMEFALRGDPMDGQSWKVLPSAGRDQGGKFLYRFRVRHIDGQFAGDGYVADGLLYQVLRATGLDTGEWVLHPFTEEDITWAVDADDTPVLEVEVDREEPLATGFFKLRVGL